MNQLSRRLGTCSLLLVTLALCSPQHATADKYKITPMDEVGHNKNNIEMWLRSPGLHTKGKISRKKLRIMTRTRLPLHVAERYDLQYRKKNRYYGLKLQKLIQRYNPPKDVDLALLHFDNKMLVPYPFRDKKAVARMDLFLAFAMQSGKNPKHFTRDFPGVKKKSLAYKDLRPIDFIGNKIVTKERWHPHVSPRIAKNFTPWRHTNTLVGIEFVKASAYARQFDITIRLKQGKPTSRPLKAKTGTYTQLRAGLRLFQSSCQFCHGAQRVGAHYGWDFAAPVPIYLYRDTAHKLHVQLRYRPSDAPTRGLMMPALKGLQKKQVRNLWLWLRAIANKPLNPYQP